ncbi:ABC transporter permease [Bacillus cereus]|uniref:ABC transporter permease n=1 Tax=Bacillus cereus TaxID=1396 RepID=UPI0009522BB7|nr:ABC-2 family transporter protein [Bacillus cereus]OLR26829.1 hypothetical protein BLD50_04970 [Bacillus cereus]
MYRLKNELSFWKTLVFINLSSNLEYRFNFILQSSFMILNNFIYIIFWLIFFNSFQQINGWGMSDMYLLTSVVTTGYGLAMIFCGNAPNVANIISMGKLDTYLLLPKNVFFHILFSKMSTKAIGDLIFGISILGLSGINDLSSICIWIVSVFFVSIIFVFFHALFGTLAFWIGKANLIQEQSNSALLAFSLYPQTIFDKFGKLLMFTILPAGMVGMVPVELIKSFNLTSFFLLVGFSIFIALVCIFMFYRGLKKYESSNIFTFRN